jgi:hypothetical protein
LVTAVGAEKLDVFVPQLLIVAIELALAPRAGHPENSCHSLILRIFSRQGAKAQSLGIKPIQNNPILPSRLCAFAGESSSPVSDLSRQGRKARKGFAATLFSYHSLRELFIFG